MGVVESGQLTLENPDSQTRTLTKGQHFGSEMLLYEKPSSFTITSLTDTVTWILNRSDWISPSPPSPPRIIHTGRSRLLKASLTLLVTISALAVVLFTLGPTLLEYGNKTLPDRFIEAERPDLAENYLRYAIRLQPESAEVYGFLADILAAQDKSPEAIETYQQAISLDEYLPWIHNNLGVLYLEQGKASLAADHFQKAVDLNPLNTDTYRNLGNAYYTQEQWNKAADAYQNALELDFTLLDIKAAWAGLILSESRLVEARLVWEDVLLGNPRHHLALQGLGVISLLEDDPALSMMYLDAAQYIDPEDLTTRLYMGMALEALNKPAEAAAAYKYIVDMGADPELFSLADTLLEILQE